MIVVIFVTVCAGGCGDSKSTSPQTDMRNRDYLPAWSPDGTSIVYLHEESVGDYDVIDYVRIIDAESGTLKRQLVVQGNIPDPWDMSWTPDGRWILFASGPGIFKLTSTLDTLVQLTSGEFHNDPSWSKAKNLIFFYSPVVATGGLLSTTLEGDSIRRWSTLESLVHATACFPDDSDSLVGWMYVRGAVRMLLFDPDNISGGELLSSIFLTAYKTRVSIDRRFIAFNAIDFSERRGENLYLLDRSSGIIEVIENTTNGFDFAPDGTKLVYPRLNGKVGLWVVDVATLEQSRLTTRQN